jgi:hypothetical protein
VQVFVYPIFINEKGEWHYESADLEKRFLKICEGHRKENKALAFAIIVCNLKHPEIWKVLGDRGYWEALNAISDRYLTVFAFHQADDVEKAAPINWAGESRTLSGPVRFLRQNFGIDLEESQPAVLFFQVRGEEIIGMRLVELEAKNVERAFHELRDLIAVVVDSIKDVKVRGNAEGIFQLLDWELAQRCGLRSLRRGLEKVLKVKELVSALT